MAADPAPKAYEHLSNKERMLQGFPYDPFTEELISERSRAKRLTDEFNAIDEAMASKDKGRPILKKLFNPNSGEKIAAEPTISVDYGYNITVGENFFINYEGRIVDVCPVKIGNNFMAGPAVTILTAMHSKGNPYRREVECGKPVTIGDDVWIGGKSVICPGVTIGNGVIVGAASVVTEDVPDFVIVGGNPARVIRKLEKPKEYP